MGRRGPPKKPTAQKILAGNPGRKPLNKVEPDFDEDDTIPCPEHITGEGREEWEKLTPMLIEFGVIRKSDTRHFEKYCIALMDLERAMKKRSTIPDNLKNLNAYLRISSHIITLRQQIRHYGQDFGLTPASRAGIHAKRPKGKKQKEAGAPATQEQRPTGNVTRFFKRA